MLRLEIHWSLISLCVTSSLESKSWFTSSALSYSLFLWFTCFRNHCISLAVFTMIIIYRFYSVTPCLKRNFSTNPSQSRLLVLIGRHSRTLHCSQTYYVYRFSFLVFSLFFVFFSVRQTKLATPSISFSPHVVHFNVGCYMIPWTPITLDCSAS